MASWQRVLAVVTYNVEEHFDKLKFRLRRRLGRLNAVIILPYRGFGSAQQFCLKGRVIEDRGVTSATDNDTIWRNLLNMYRRFASDEIRGARVRASFGRVTAEAITDTDGYFELTFRPDPDLLSPDQEWYDVTLELVEYPGPRHTDTMESAAVLVPRPSAQFGVISDLDDTVIQSDVVNLLKLARNTFLKNSRTRLPFEGVAAFYQALQAGSGDARNPIFYVSSGPWNLYDLIVDFFDVRGIPAGPLFLADLGPTSHQIIKPDRRKHKLAQIRRILATYPHLPFVLIGDSGEIDPEIYLQTVEEHPGRIKAIYIRDVGGDEDRQPTLAQIIESAKRMGSEMLLVHDTVAAAVHASLHGLIDPSALPEISREKSEDTQPPTVLEQLIDDEAPA